MNAIKVYEDACRKADNSEITLGEFEKIIEPLMDVEPVIRCKDCKYQEKYFHKDRRMKDGGYYIYGCEFADGYSHVCLDDDFCSRAERKES